MEGERCKRCGDFIEKDELGWFCRGCDHRTSADGRKSSRQPTKGQKALRRFKDRELAKATDALGDAFGADTIAGQQALFRHRRLPRARQLPKRWCKPCDALFVIRSGRVVCWRCGVLWEAS